MPLHPVHLPLLALERGWTCTWAQTQHAALDPARPRVEADLPNGLLDAPLGIGKVGSVGVQNAHELKLVEVSVSIPVP